MSHAAAKFFLRLCQYLSCDLSTWRILSSRHWASAGPGKIIKTKADFQMTDYLPKTAALADKLCVIRSMTGKIGEHVQAQYYMDTAYKKSNTIYHPRIGAWAQHYLGQSHKTLPSTVCINSPAGHGNGFMSSTFSPLPIRDAEAGLQHAKSSEGMDELERQLSLLNRLDRGFRERYPDEQIAAYTNYYDNAVQLMKGGDTAAFDLTQEPAAMRETYGASKFGQGCLLARRLIEAGVRYVEVVSDNICDMHQNLDSGMEDQAPPFDQAYAALIADLEQRGLLKDTLIVLATEFGRKPQWSGSGRGHYPLAFSSVLCGAGVKRGMVYGATDALGAQVTKDPVTAEIFNATIGWALGLPIEQEIISDSGRPFTVGNKAKPITGVFS